ncbi:hypothetical protein D3C85_1079230 [compost metagenome]
MAVGVPLITPVVVFKFNPAGSATSILKLSGIPPVIVGGIAAIVVPLNKTLGTVYCKLVVGTFLTSIFNVALEEPNGLTAVTT